MATDHLHDCGDHYVCFIDVFVLISTAMTYDSGGMKVKTAQ